MSRRLPYRALLPCLIHAAVIGLPLPCLASQQIEVTSTFRVTSPHGPLNVVRVQYEFPDRSLVVASSHGLVLGKGTLRFLTKANRLDFLDPTSGALLESVEIEAGAALMGRKETLVPLEADFPATSQTGRWDQRRPFADNLIRVLNRHFPNGYLPIRNEDERLFITAFKVFDERISAERARVATMIKLPFSTDLEEPTLFRVHFLAQERRSRTEWRRAESEAVITHVHNFVWRLTRELAGEIQ